MKTKLSLAIVVLLLALAAMAAVAQDQQVPYPTGYRSWQHVKSMAILPGHALYDSFGGIHHLYANRKAMTGYRSGTFPNGSVIVFDLLAENASGNTLAEGKRKVVGVMHKDARRYAETGGWGFEGFAGDSTTERAVGSNAKTACFDCHAPQKDKDYVFSGYRQ